MAAMMSRLAHGLLPPLPLLLLLLPLLIQTAVADDATVTITDYPGFTSQRTCAQQCVWNRFGVPFGCPTPVQNGCYCRNDLISSAARSMATCVSVNCQSNSIDAASATSIYSAYCSQNGHAAAVPTAGAGGSGGSGSGSGSGAGSGGGGANAATPAQGAGTAIQTSGTNNGNSGAGNGCGNQVANVSGVNIVCGSKSGAGVLAADPRRLALAIGISLCLIVWLVV